MVVWFGAAQGEAVSTIYLSAENLVGGRPEAPMNTKEESSSI